ncbi:phosphoglucomutase/phosphomannomutase family protein [Caproiciproducens faecalis]|uniref:Phosphoglucomutase n=1 Tax=Caproiciproducens faecalis TaxID=2820301 RepID=A0ABS7DJP0_9FIRM|nr:phosphoglucomutase/phosphomannomutase family protein [Caproiciproducens faecalis]MBW7571433.1 phosphoglucomutase/phosphomannomutase family protein [Caproiciproducens faecalis]
MIQFGTGGFRAIIGEDFTRSNLELLSAALAKMIKKDHLENHPVVIGYDRRFLSDLGSKWIACTLAAEGIGVHLINHDAPTPLIMFQVLQENAAYGMAVTASHNPAEYNGVKLFTSGGRDATEEVTDRVEKEISGIRPSEIRTMEYEKAVEDGLIVEIDPQNHYIDSILNVIDIEAIKKKNLKILLDPMFGVSKTTLQTILLTCRCNVEVIHDRHDTLFGGRLPAPNSSTLTHLAQMVVQNGYDLGIATDGDADRIGLIDSSGTFIHPNDILVLLYYYLHEYKGWKGAVVRSIATTHCLDRMAESFGETSYEVPVGFKHISSKMEETDALIGGESSGGLTVRGHIHGKDGVYAGSLLVEMMSVMGKSLRDILDEIHRKYGNFVMDEFDCRMTGERKEELQKLLFEEKQLPLFDLTVEKISYLDGCKVYFKNGGWIICRFSGTEPVLRIFCEMENAAEAERISRVFRDFLGL